MFGLILVCGIVLSYVIDLDVWQSVVVLLFFCGVWLTGRRVRHG